MRHRAVVLAAGLLLACPALLLTSPASARARAAAYDFDGDGHPELVVGTPRLQVGSHPGAGGVVVLPGSRHGVSLRERVITQSSPRVVGKSEDGDHFGAALASADFDRDGYADLAIGQPGETSGPVEHVGAVTVVYGSSRGLDTRHARRISARPEAGQDARFGEALAAGDFDQDGFADLAVGSPGDDPGPPEEFFEPSGTVSLIKGGPHGLTGAGRLVLRRDEDPSHGDMLFGVQLAAGDLDQDGGTDLVVASAGAYDWGDDPYPGSLGYCLGRRSGPIACTQLERSPRLTSPGTLAVGNVLGTSRPEIVVGEPHPSEQGTEAVQVIALNGQGPLVPAGGQTLVEADLGLPSHVPNRFGLGVALGDLDHDGYADLVVGAPGDQGGRGRVDVVHGGSAGLRTADRLSFTQDTPGIPGTAETRDAFGVALTLLDHDGDGHPDLAVGAPGENGGRGAVTLLPGSGTAFEASSARTVTLKKLGRFPRGDAGFGEVLGQ